MGLRKKFIRWTLLVGIVLIAGQYVYGQFDDEYFKKPIEKKTFDEEQWKEMVEDLEYIQQEKENERDWEFEPDFNMFPSEILPYIKYGLIFLVSAVLAFLIFRLLYKNYWNKGEFTKVDMGLEMLDDLEENIHHADLDGLLEKALAEERYQLAVRIYYLLVVRRLSDIGFIQWKKEKTNATYVAEMAGQEDSGAFRQLTREYERVWFGNRQLTKTGYQKISPPFENLYSKLAAHLTDNETATA